MQVDKEQVRNCIAFGVPGFAYLGGGNCRILSQSVARRVASSRLGGRKCAILFRSVPCRIACLRAWCGRGDALAGLQRGSTLRAAVRAGPHDPPKKRPKAAKSGQNRENRPKAAMRKLAKPAKNGQKRPEPAKNGPKMGKKTAKSGQKRPCRNTAATPASPRPSPPARRTPNPRRPMVADAA